MGAMYKLSNYKFRPYGGGPSVVEPKPEKTKKEKSWFLLMLSKLTT
jgi:hypothetical protein